MSRLVRKLGLADLVDEAPLGDVRVRPRSVSIPLRQHAGAAAEPVVSVGRRVREGDCLANPPKGKLGAPVHASLDGRVLSVGEAVVIEAE
mgnify:FL=1